MNTLLSGKDRINFDTVKIYPIPKNNIYKEVFLCIQMDMSHIILITKDIADMVDIADMMDIAELQDTMVLVILMDGGLGEGASSHFSHSSHSSSRSFGKML
jgi:hypothetical protein